MSSCDFTVSAVAADTVKPGDLIVVRYGSSRRYFVRHDDGTGDLIAWTDNAMVPGSTTHVAWDRTTSGPWTTMMRAQRGEIIGPLASNLPRCGTPRDAFRAVVSSIETAHGNAQK